MVYIIYRSYACLINIFNSFLKRGLFLRIFIFIQLSLHILFKLKTKFFLRDFLLYGTYLSRKKKIRYKCYSYRITINAVECKKILFYKYNSYM